MPCSKTQRVISLAPSAEYSLLSALGVKFS